MGGLSFGNYRLDTLKNAIYRDGHVLELEPQVYSLLELLITRHGELVSRDEIIAEIWDGRIISNSVIDNRIRAARAAIGDTGRDQRYIKTYPNRGYKFIGEMLKDETASPVSVAEVQVSQTYPDGVSANDNTTKSSLSWLRSPVTYIAALALLGLSGAYLLTGGGESTETRRSAEALEENATLEFDLSALNKKTDFPRVAILPVEMIGDETLYGLLPEVLESEFNQAIAAIEDMTVVSLLPGAKINEDAINYKRLEKEFELDYVVSSELSSYGGLFKLTVSLIRAKDGSVLCGETYDLGLSDGDVPQDLLANIAPKITLMTANKLNLSVGNLPTSWKNYGFYAKIQEAEAIGEQADYESVKKAVKLLREAIEEEPNYIPAYSRLIYYLSHQINFVVGDYEPLLKEQAEVAIKMQKISPGAPETLLNNAFLGTMSDDGVFKAAMGERVEYAPLTVAKYILNKDPDNFFGMTSLAYLSEFTVDQSETVAQYKNAWQLSPTDSWVLPNYSRALFCNENYAEAREIINRSSKWHPNHRTTLVAKLQQANAIGDYEASIDIVNRLRAQGIISQEETADFVGLFYDLGRPEVTEQHIRFSPDKAFTYAMMGKKEPALREADVIDSFYTSVRARMIADGDYIPESYNVDMAYSRVGSPEDTTRANMCRLDHLILDAYVLKRMKSEKYSDFLALLRNYYRGRDVEDFKTRQEFTALMGLHLLQSDPDKAIEIMDIAMARGFLFIDRFKEPFLRDLKGHPGLAKRLDEMRAKSDLLMTQLNRER